MADLPPPIQGQASQSPFQLESSQKLNTEGTFRGKSVKIEDPNKEKLKEAVNYLNEVNKVSTSFWDKLKNYFSKNVWINKDYKINLLERNITLLKNMYSKEVDKSTLNEKYREILKVFRSLNDSTNNNEEKRRLEHARNQLLVIEGQLTEAPRQQPQQQQTQPLQSADVQPAQSAPEYRPKDDEFNPENPFFIEADIDKIPPQQ